MECVLEFVCEFEYECGVLLWQYVCVYEQYFVFCMYEWVVVDLVEQCVGVGCIEDFVDGVVWVFGMQFGGNCEQVEVVIVEYDGCVWVEVDNGVQGGE